MPNLTRVANFGFVIFAVLAHSINLSAEQVANNKESIYIGTYTADNNYNRNYIIQKYYRISQMQSKKEDGSYQFNMSQSSNFSKSDQCVIVPGCRWSSSSPYWRQYLYKSEPQSPREPYVPCDPREFECEKRDPPGPRVSLCAYINQERRQYFCRGGRFCSGFKQEIIRRVWFDYKVVDVNKICNSNMFLPYLYSLRNLQHLSFNEGAEIKKSCDDPTRALPRPRCITLRLPITNNVDTVQILSPRYLNVSGLAVYGKLPEVDNFTTHEVVVEFGNENGRKSIMFKINIRNIR